MRKFLAALAVFFTFEISVLSDVPHFIDFKLILNESTAGKKAQKILKDRLENGVKNLKEKEKKNSRGRKKNYSTKKNFIIGRI